ncbi:hypothetical protein KY331_04010 [Candidatus Woesearchaeota archaeon]|nr:hypothetical protein [Candidatus Woesearchaeota archaeon]
MTNRMRDYGFEENGMPYDRLNDRLGSRTERNISRETNRTFYVCIDELVDQPKTEMGVGDFEAIKEVGQQYEPADSPFVMIRYYDRADGRYGFVKIHFKGDHKDITENLGDYVQQMNCDLVNYMRNQNPDGDLRGKLTVHGTDDPLVLKIFEKRIKAEELVIYE